MERDRAWWAKVTRRAAYEGGDTNIGTREELGLVTEDDFQALALEAAEMSGVGTCWLMHGRFDPEAVYYCIPDEAVKVIRKREAA